MSARVAIVRFPGTNCEFDVAHVCAELGAQPEIVFHHQTSLAGADAVILPGGFAHGDYLRAGAIARFSPVMDAVTAFARAGGPVLGICNGFQVLCEAGLLPGALMRNAGLRFVCATVRVRVDSTRSVLTATAEPGAVLTLPVNHFEGCYTCDDRTLASLRDTERVVLRYLDNPNGSVDDIAGVCNEDGNVVGLMPHPERAGDPLLGSDDGLVLLRAVCAAATGRDRSEATVATGR